MKKEDIIKLLKSIDIADALHNYGIKHIFLFGSFARGEQRSDSDIDLLYQKYENSHMSLFDHIDSKFMLEELLGRKIDLVSQSALNSHIAPYILKDKTLIF